MSLSKLEKLMYTIGIVDKATGPVNKIMGKMQQLSAQTAGAQDHMMRGMMGAAGGAMMLVGSLNPAIAANEALGEVSSLGVAESSLQQLNQTSLNFAAQYGGNAADVISSSYDIQSSISGLTGEELSAFTKASAIMAKGTKSDASTATDYMGTMYGIYQNNAKDMGKNAWVEQLAGQTATAVRMFKTNGSEMASAFSNLGAGAQSHGIEMAESMAVLGQLQATMSGSEAATKYKAFLSGVGKAQQTLGVQLTDVQGKMLPMADVLDKLQGKFGAIDTVAKSDALKKAFGSEEAVGLIKSLLPQVDQLTDNIIELNKQSGMQTAIDMANAQTSAWQRLSGGFNAAATSLGQAVLPIIEPVVEMLASMLSGVLWLSQTFPVLTGIVAAVAVGITALMIAIGLMNMTMGLSKYAMIGFSSMSAVTTKAIAGLSWAFSTAQLALSRFQITAAFTGGYLSALRVAMLGASSSAWAFTAALLANPITWIIAGIILLAAVVYRYWKPIKSFMSGFWDGLKQGFAPVIGLFSNLMTALAPMGDMLSWVGEKVGAIVGWFSGLLGPVDESSAALQAATDAGFTFGQILGAAFDSILIPIKVAMYAITKLIDLISWAGNGIKDFFGFGDDVDVTATKTIDHLVKSQNMALPESTLAMSNRNIGQSSHVYQINEFSARQALAVKVPQPQSVTSNTAIVDTSNIAQFSSIAERSSRIEKYKQSNQALATTNTQRVNKTNYFSQNNNSSNSNSSASADNSKRVYIDNITMKSDNISDDFEQLMELAG